MTESNSPELTVLWSDDHLVVVNKPAGLPTLPDGYDKAAPHLAQTLAADFGRVWIAHRLDRGTSGVIVVARTAEAHRSLNMQFDARQVSKTYHALALGVPTWDEYAVRLPLLADGDRKHRTIVDSRRGKPAVTHLAALERYAIGALIEARPETGRTHQIRAHLAALRLPVLGDALYGGAAATEPADEDGTLIDRTALHAATLSFCHPVTQQLMCFEAPYPPDFVRALRGMKQGA